MVSLEKDVMDKVASEKQSKKEVPDSESLVPHQAPDNGPSLLPSDDKGGDQTTNDGVTPLLQSDDKGSPQSVTPSKAFQVPEGAVAALQSLQEGSNSSLTSEKALLTPETGAIVLQSGQEGSTSSRVRERPLEDGYNWRKYGQKLVRGNIFVRSYYRCTHPKCPVKRQVERSHKGQITDTVYFGQHEHPKPRLSVPIAVGFAVSACEETAEVPLLTSVQDTPLEAHKGNTSAQIELGVPLQHPSVADNEGVEGMLSLSNRARDGEPDSKRQKKEEKQNGNAILVDKPTGEPREQREPRVVVQTMSEVDIVGDGYRWRKYGQKLVKGNPNPRSYYRCSNPGCPVKKHVERAVNDSKVVIATYEGQHHHDIPLSRIVTPTPAASNVHFIDSCTKPEENDVSLALVVHTNPEREIQPVEQLNGNLRTKSQRSDDVAASDMVVDSDLGLERKVDEHLIGKAFPKQACETPAILRRANKVQNGDSESIPSDQEKRKPAEPVQG